MSTRILALDTATEACSTALWVDGEVYAVSEVCPREHTQRILPMVQQMLAEAGLTLNQLDALAFGRGPGSFTGVRIGVGVAQGLALGADLPMIGVSNLLAMAQGAYRVQQHQQVLVAIDARMGEVYWGQYLRADNGEWQVLGEEAVLEPQSVQVITAGEAHQWATAGTGFTAYPTLAQQDGVELIDSGILLPEARDMLPQALACWQRGEVVAVENAAPVYLRNNVAWKKLPGRE